MPHEVTDEMLKTFEHARFQVEHAAGSTPESRYDERQRAGLAAVLDLLDAKHEPRRGSDVEAWLKRMRDVFAEKSDATSITAWTALDTLLDDYRLHADTGVPLDSTEPMGPTTAGVADDA